MRALLLHLLRWVEDDTAPPASQMPRIDAAMLVLPSKVTRAISFLEPPRSPHVAYRQDFGPAFDAGVIAHQPPRRGPAYGVRVPQVAGLGSERSGIRALALRAPVGSYTPWARRIGAPFAADEMTSYLGTFVPLALTAEQRREGDSRPSLAELYSDRAAYQARVAAELDAMIAEGWVLARDKDREHAAAMARWDWLSQR